MFVATVTARTSQDHSVTFDVLGVSEDKDKLLNLCDAEISADSNPGTPLTRWKTSGMRGYYKRVTINDYDYFYAVDEVENVT